MTLLVDAATGSAALRPVCDLTRLTPDRGVAALVDGTVVALFLLHDGELCVVDNHDPISEANVLSRGLVGDVDGAPTVASPIYKQRFDLRTGRCLDAAGITIGVHEAQVDDAGVVCVRVAPAGAPSG